MIVGLTGNTYNYNDAVPRLLRAGNAVFAPHFDFQSELDTPDKHISRNIRAIVDRRAKWIGTSMLASVTIFEQ